MNYESFLIKYSEIGLKGKNRYKFEDALVSRIRETLKEFEGVFNVYKEQERIYIDSNKDFSDIYDKVIEKLKRVFGIFTICPIKKIPFTSNYKELSDSVIVRLFVEIRNHINLYSEKIQGPGGLPVGTSGKAMLLLSGGIDSPVAGYMIAKRGVVINAIYFHAPPYTSDRAKQKVIDLAKIVSKWQGT